MRTIAVPSDSSLVLVLLVGYPLTNQIADLFSHFGSTNQIKGQRSRGQRFNGSPKLNDRAKVTCPRLVPAMSSIEHIHRDDDTTCSK